MIGEDEDDGVDYIDYVTPGKNIVEVYPDDTVCVHEATVGEETGAKVSVAPNLADDVRTRYYRDGDLAAYYAGTHTRHWLVPNTDEVAVEVHNVGDSRARVQTEFEWMDG